MSNLDSDLLRTFLAVAEAGSVTGGASRIHRSQSAASIQVRQLEEILGKPVFERHGRGVLLTETGEKLAPVAQRVTQALDAVMNEISGKGLSGSLRIGIPDEHGREYLTTIISGFARAHPMVDLSVHCALSSAFPSALAAGDLDLAVHEVAEVEPGMTLLREVPMHWVGPRGLNLLDCDPLPVALFDRACWWRQAALQTLEKSCIAFRVAFTSESITGIAAAIEAGVAIGVLDRSTITPRMAILTEAQGFGSLPVSKLVLQTAAASRSAHCEAMVAAIKTAYGYSAE